MEFPLPLENFEEYMLADDRQTYPMDFFFRLRFSEHLDRSALAAALHDALDRNPMLRALVRETGKSREEWVIADGDDRQPVWLDAPPADGYPPCDQIDLRQHAGLRLFAWDDGDGDYLLLQFHHASCDGLAAIQFIEDLCVAYGNRSGLAALDYRSLDPSLLRGRGRFGLTFGKIMRLLPKQLTGLKGVRQFLMRRPAPLIRDSRELAAVPLPDAFPAAITLRYDRRQTQVLRKLAADSNVTVNDILLTEIFRGVDEFQRQQGDGGKKWIRFTVPINLRTSADRRLSAANVVAMVFLDRRPRHIANREKLLASVHDEMELIKRKQLGLISAFTLSVARRLPSGMKNCVRADRCNATAVVTNLGRVSMMRVPRKSHEAIIGDLRITDFDILAPIRPQTNVAFAIFEYGKRLSITLHYDARVLTREVATGLGDCLDRLLRDLTVSGD